VTSPRVGGGGSGEGTSAAQSTYAKNKKPWDM